MLSESDKVLSSFRGVLDTLRENDKNKIIKLTNLARDNIHLLDVPPHIVQATAQHIKKAQGSAKLVGLYVIDSIVKTVELPYRKLFTGKVVGLFVHSFKMLRDEVTRKRLFNLRTTWKEIFPYPLMNSLDMQVREHDPAWPIIPCDERRTHNPIPSVPKIPKEKLAEKKTPVASSQLPGPVTEAVIAEARDPRRNRKRKSPPPESIEGNFLIDRDGNRKMESIARKQGKEEGNKPPLKKNKGLAKDQDMRSAPTSRSLSSTPRALPGERQQDVDMRLVSSLPTSSAPAATSSSSRSPMDTAPPARPALSPAMSLPRVASGECLPRSGGGSMSTLPPLPPPPHMQQLPHNMPPSSYHRPYHQPPPHRPSPEQQQPLPYNRQRNIPPIRGPMWTVEIDGLPEMIDIGIDPRMLSRVQNPKMARQITVDGRQYPLLLDRVQPLIQVEDRLHAVRFRCDSLAFVIDHQRYCIPAVGFTRIRAAGRERIAYLGGPGHEIVIDGRPHTVPFNSSYATINVERQTVPISYACEFPQDVNVLPEIPPKVLDWAARGLFGSPGSLHLAPLNPLAEMERHAENGGRFDQHNHHSAQSIRRSPPDAASTVETEQAPPPSTTISTPAAAPPVDVQCLFQKLVAAGVFNKTSEKPPDLKDYDWEVFRKPCTKEIDVLYSGFQCAQCGIRFESEVSKEFADHLDYHYLKNTAEQREHRNRAYYQPVHYWLLSEMSNEGAPQFTASDGVEEQEEVKCPSFADESRNICAVCFEKFDTFFDRDEGEWMLRGAVLVDDKLYHPICKDDAGKQFTAEPKPVVVVPEQTTEDVSSPCQNEPAPSDPQENQGESVSPPTNSNKQRSPVQDAPGASPQLDSPSASTTTSTIIRQSVNGLDSLLTSSSVPSAPLASNPLESITVKKEATNDDDVLGGDVRTRTPPLSTPSAHPVKPEEPESIGGHSGAPAISIPGLSPSSFHSEEGNRAVHDDGYGDADDTPDLARTPEVEEGANGGSVVGGGDDSTGSENFIAANPLEALQAVLRGDTSFLMKQAH